MNKLVCKIIIFLQLIFMTNVFASSDSGLEIKAGKYELKITYSDADDVGESLEYLQDPSGLLFDLIYFIQNNYKKISEQENKLWIIISVEVPIINVLKFNKNSDKYESHLEFKYAKMNRDLMRKTVCQLIDINNCLNFLSKQDKTINLYELKKNDAGFLHENTILFGPFPSDQLKVNFTLLSSKENCKHIKKYKVSKKVMSKYFERLE